MSGRRGTAPCGHEGEAIIGHYYQCLQRCDQKPKRGTRLQAGFILKRVYTDQEKSTFKIYFENGLRLVPGQGILEHAGVLVLYTATPEESQQQKPIYVTLTRSKGVDLFAIESKKLL